jgi:DNA repair protein RecO (recombination protein O)
MNQLNTTAIILSRTDFGEADRILTLLTPDCGKLRLVAKGVRRVKSKLAGGIELFSVSHVTFIRGRSDMGTLVSTRLVKHYGGIVKDLQRTMLGYELIKQLHKITEDEPESEYFDLLQQTFEALGDADVSLPLVQFWFAVQLLRLGGHTPNLQTDTSGQKLDAEQTYMFDFVAMAFAPHDRGQLTADHIKFLRLSFAGNSAKVLGQVQGSAQLVEAATPLVQQIANFTA